MSEFIGNGDLLKAIRHHAEGHNELLGKLVEYSACAANHTGELTHAIGKTNDLLVGVGDLLERLLASSALIQAFTASTEDNTEAIVKALQAAGGQDAILKNVMDDLATDGKAGGSTRDKNVQMMSRDEWLREWLHGSWESTVVGNGGVAKFGRKDIIGTLRFDSSPLIETEIAAEPAGVDMVKHAPTEAMRLRTELSNAYDQLAQANDRCNEIAGERDETLRIVDGQAAMITKLQNKLAGMGFTASQIDEISN